MSQEDPCAGSPCGPYSNCRIVDKHPVCACQQFCIGAPPSCRPECLVSADCAQNRACINKRCLDPCPGTCGLRALCQVVGHNPVCSCPNGYTGDPFLLCTIETPSKLSLSFQLIFSFLLISTNVYCRTSAKSSSS